MGTGLPLRVSNFQISIPGNPVKSDPSLYLTEVNVTHLYTLIKPITDKKRMNVVLNNK